MLVERGMSHNQKIVMKGEADQQVRRLIFILRIAYFGGDHQGLVTRGDSHVPDILARCRDWGRRFLAADAATCDHP